MKNFHLKSIILGIGIGIVFTAMIGIIYNAGGYSSMSREKIIETAKSYGMIEPESIIPGSDSKKSSSGLYSNNEKSETKVNNGNKNQSSTLKDDIKQPENNANSTQSKAETAASNGQPAVSPVNASPQPENVDILIAEGDTSYAVGEKLATAGIISSSEEFSNAIVNAGMQSRIRAGSYKFVKGTGVNEIINTIATVIQ